MRIVRSLALAAILAIGGTTAAVAGTVAEKAQDQAEAAKGGEDFSTEHEDLLDAAHANRDEALNDVLDRVPEQAQDAVQNALDHEPGAGNSQAGENGKPEWAPGPPSDTPPNE